LKGFNELPLYEYACEKCGHHFEKIEHVDAPETKKCPKCGGKAPRLLSAPAIQFKGTGWYVTDYAGKSSGNSGDGPPKGDDKAASDTSSKKTEKTEVAKEGTSKSKSKKKE